MKIDNYVKSLLTVIALCLLYLCLRDLTRPPQRVSAAGPISVQSVDWSSTWGRGTSMGLGDVVGFSCVNIPEMKRTDCFLAYR
jgi:hypothetical protein